MASAIRHQQAAVSVRAIGDDLLLLNKDTNRIHQLNATASFIWRCCERAASADEIAGLMVAEFAVDEHEALQDVVETLSLLRELSLVVDAAAG
jgi:Coenzyme PQQ synthesis protein D (PqqD)